MLYTIWDKLIFKVPSIIILAITNGRINDSSIKEEIKPFAHLIANDRTKKEGQNHLHRHSYNV